MRYWYAIQNENYVEVIEEGSLWTCPRPNGVQLEPGRSNIFELLPGDVVFHHANSYLRAVSIVIEEATDFPRGSAYWRRREGEGDAGWLVGVDPVRTDLNLHYTQVANIISHGAPGPFTVTGTPQRKKYLSPLAEEEGINLLALLGVDLPPPTDEGLFGRPLDDWTGGETDGITVATIRKEQTNLRRSHLRGRLTAPCSICQSDLPVRLLIAGHIKPRSHCTETERKNHNAAMLICNLGCDALFEWGYIVVGDDGKVQPGLTAETPELKRSVDALIGKTCTAYNETTAQRFKFHMELKLNKPTDRAQ